MSRSYYYHYHCYIFPAISVFLSFFLFIAPDFPRPISSSLTIFHHLSFSLLRRRFYLDYHPSIIRNDTLLCLLFHLIFRAISLRIAHMIALQKPALLPSAKVDISLLLKPQDEEDDAPPGTTATSYQSRPVLSAPTVPPMTVASPPGQAVPPPLSANKIPASIPAKRLQPAHSAESPAKKQSKWSPEEDALIIDLRGSGMKWEDISKRLPGRSAISCRLHYQNYLERRGEWDEDKKNKLARLYERYAVISAFSPSLFTLLTRAASIDSRPRCGQKWQRKWRFRGELQKLCTGSWENKKWPDEPVWCHFLFRVPPSTLPRPGHVEPAHPYRDPGNHRFRAHFHPHNSLLSKNSLPVSLRMHQLRHMLPHGSFTGWAQWK